MKKSIITLSAVSLTLSLTSCFPTSSTNPLGDGFSSASNAIGSVVNKVLPSKPAVPQFEQPAIPSAPAIPSLPSFNPTYIVPVQ